MFDWLFNWLQQALTWFLDVVLFLPKWILQELLGALSSLLNSIPVPDWMLSAQGYLSGIPSSVVWFLDIMHFGFGVTVVFSALVLKWLLHRIPFIG